MQISNRAGLAILLVTVLVSSTVLFPLLQRTVSREPQLSAYGDDWNDLSRFRNALETKGYNITSVLSSPAVIADLEYPSQTLVVVAGTESPYSGLEVEVLVAYLEAGGRMLVMGDFDYSNTLAELFTVRFAGHRLWDQNYVSNVSMLRVDGHANGQDYTLLLNQPTALRTRQPVASSLWSSGVELTEQVFASTSPHSYLDLDDDGDITQADEVASSAGFAVGVRCTLKVDGEERGQALFLGDSSPGINRMWGYEDNGPFLLALVAELLPDGGTVLFDESRHTQDSFGASLFQAAIGFYFLLAGQTLILHAIRLNVLVLVVLATLMLALRQPDPTRWRHLFDIHRPRPWRGLGDPDVEILQQVLLERMRLKYQLYELDDLGSEERLKLAPELVKRYNILLDAGLSDLLLRPGKLKPQEMRKLAQKIQMWSL